jgi:hypothetical protein
MGPLTGPDLDLFSFLILLLLLDSAYVSSDFLSYLHFVSLGDCLIAGWVGFCCTSYHFSRVLR